MPWLLAVFAASLLGSLHCAGMCGGFVTCLAGDCAKGRGRLHGAYHLGRGLGYATLGALAGLLGTGIERGSTISGESRIAPVLFGTLIIIFAAFTGARALGVRIPIPVPTRPTRVIARILARLRGQGPGIRGGTLGLLTAFLPCGWLYAFVATAAGTGSVLGGIATMLFFWAGTVPILLGLGLGTDRLLAPVRARLPIVGSILLLVLGLGTLFGRGVQLPLDGPEPRPSAAEKSTPFPEIPTTAPCCAEPDLGKGADEWSTP